MPSRKPRQDAFRLKFSAHGMVLKPETNLEMMSDEPDPVVFKKGCAADHVHEQEEAPKSWRLPVSC
jgi:hypothetical protein